MDRGDMQLLRELETGLPLVSHPYAAVGDRIGMTEEEVINRITVLQNMNIIRRMRARINQRRVGILANALVAWKIAESESDSAGARLAAMPGVTHCYRRSPVPEKWEYTLYTVHHGWSREEVTRQVSMIAEKTGYQEYRILFSTKEYKRIPHTRSEDLEENP